MEDGVRFGNSNEGSDEHQLLVERASNGAGIGASFRAEEQSGCCVTTTNDAFNDSRAKIVGRAYERYAHLE